jgi:hypothetical protein
VSEYSSSCIDLRADEALISAAAPAEPGARSQAPDDVDASGIATLSVLFEMQPRRHRMRRQARRESSRAWIASGATVTIKTYARRYGVNRYTAYEDLTAIGFPLPDSARRWAHRPPPQPRPRRSATPPALLDDDWIMIDGRPYFIAGCTSGGAPYGTTSTRWTTT